MTEPVDVVSLTRSLVDIDSTTGHEGDAGRWLADYLRVHGFHVSEQPVDPRRANVIATAADARPPVVTLSTHFDCVPPFFGSRLEDERIYGRGACDAKGILAAQVAAADLLRREGETRVGLLFVVGEERGSDGARAANAAANRNPGSVNRSGDVEVGGRRFLVNGEPTDRRLGAATRGALRLRFQASGRAAHSSFPELGESAIDTLIDALLALRGIALPEDEILGRTHYTIGLIAGGVAPNVVSPSAQAEVMFRTVSEAEAVRRAIEPLERRVAIEHILEVPPVRMITLPDFESAVFPYTTDIPYLTGWGEPLLYGPGSIHVAHTADEFIEISELKAAVHGYATIARELLDRAARWYTRRIAGWDREIARGERRHLLVSNLRLLTALAAALLAWLGFLRGTILPQWSFIPAALFLILIVVHARVLSWNERALRARRLYQHGIARIEDRWSGTGADGARFLDDHPYARDLDLFGNGSLFQLLNVARTESGEATLADWLKAPASIEDARARQTGVAELRDKVDFREDLAVIAAEARVSRTGSLARWTLKEPVGFSRTHAWLLAGFALVTAVLVPAAFAGWIPGAVAFTWVALQAAVSWRWRRQMHEVLHRVDAAAYDLGLLTELLARLERETFASERLVAIHRLLFTDGHPPSRHIARLQRYIAARDMLRNEFARPFAMLLLVRIQSAVAIDRWHAAYRQQLTAWLTVIGEIEALASLGTFAYEHPADPFPVLHADGPVVSATALAHPLIASAVAVPNDLRLGGPAPQVLIISGSNMSGKSTLLRAAGVNVVLALAGGTVRAAQMDVSRLAIGATIRVEDSLQEGRSKFYAEILRISGIVKLSRGEAPVLFLLDEILHGTNSFDRRIGAEAIVRALVGAGAIGLVTTHDLALTELTATLGDQAANVHFEDRIEDGKMLFDYRMRDGVVEHSNALALMRAIGIDV